MDAEALVGAWVAAGALAAATGLGVWHRARSRRSWRPRPPAAATPPAADHGYPALITAAPAGTAAPANTPAAGAASATTAAGTAAPRTGPAEPGDLAALGAEPGAVTLVQFSSAFCAPCRATRRVLADVAARVDGLRHVEIDAESHLDVVRAHGIRRTPTVLIVDRAGRLVGRAVGQPSRDRVLAAVAPLLADGSA
ncbi:hypothetical protein GCM10010123_45410 [Pilimelia anulata]|uniref:Thioredoxin domain-containing protein n=1 Tax=Pilimelia anulata TaxID=53371 RepID=A0A8J3BKH5_9ACTN|nr:thioredoxin family protein [Pilimelia anulata]GGK10329.1 hypothetical protein GCM10010123_45410 [Pilimelia anulata]